MLAFTIGALSFVLCALIRSTALEKRQRVIRLVHDRSPPEITQQRNLIWHLFLSHSWRTGQYPAAIIKKELSMLLPGCRIFLDVDDLDDISKLEEYIRPQTPFFMRARA